MLTLVDHPVRCPMCGRTYYLTADAFLTGCDLQVDYYELSEPGEPDPEEEARWYHGWEVVECPRCYIPIPLKL
jgi:adenine-specific DNA methylase